MLGVSFLCVVVWADVFLTEVVRSSRDRTDVSQGPQFRGQRSLTSLFEYQACGHIRRAMLETKLEEAGSRSVAATCIHAGKRSRSSRVVIRYLFTKTAQIV